MGQKQKIRKMSLDEDVNKYLDVLWLQTSDGLPARATVRLIDYENAF